MFEIIEISCNLSAAGFECVFVPSTGSSPQALQFGHEIISPSPLSTNTTNTGRPTLTTTEGIFRKKKKQKYKTHPQTHATFFFLVVFTLTHWPPLLNSSTESTFTASFGHQHRHHFRADSTLCKVEILSPKRELRGGERKAVPLGHAAAAACL